jgi:hypothetical protein
MARISNDRALPREPQKGKYCASYEHKTAIQSHWSAFVPGIGRLRLCVGFAVQAVSLQSTQGRFTPGSASEATI